MNIQETIDKMLARNLSQHQKLAERAVRFDAGLVANDIEGLIIEVKPTIELLRRDLEQHFLQEDNWFFPAVLMSEPDYECTRMVLDLQEEHGSLLTDLDYVIANLDDATRETEFITKEDLERLHAYLQALKVHAAKEMTHVFSLFKEAGPVLTALGECIKENPPDELSR